MRWIVQTQNLREGIEESNSCSLSLWQLEKISYGIRKEEKVEKLKKEGIFKVDDTFNKWKRFTGESGE